MLIALLSTLLAQSPVPSPVGPIFSAPSSMGSLAFFEFAPASGAGMGAACACTTPTGAKGEALAFARSGNATCSRQGTPTMSGILDGDLVSCGANQPRVEAMSGEQTLRLESSARTNSILQSAAFTSGSWSVANGGAPAPGNPTITNDATTAPDGTVTAERVDFPSTTGTGYSVLYNTLGRTSTATSWTHSLYVKGVSGSGTIYFMSVNNTATVFNSVACSFVSTSWTRCTVTGTETVATWYTQIGFDLRDATQSGQGAQSVYIWGAQGEEGATVTSYIPTTTIAVTRGAEDAYFAKSVPTTAGVCTAATVRTQSLANFPGGSGLYAPMLNSAAGAATSPYLWPFTASLGASLAIDGTGSTGAPTAYNPALDNPTLTGRYVAGHNGTYWFYTVNGVTKTNGSGSAWSSPTYTHIKLNYPVLGAANWSRVQVDPSYSRCAP